jgi:hypothetical protein
VHFGVPGLSLDVVNDAGQRIVSSDAASRLMLSSQAIAG